MDLRQRYNNYFFTRFFNLLLENSNDLLFMFGFAALGFTVYKCVDYFSNIHTNSDLQYYLEQNGNFIEMLASFDLNEIDVHYILGKEQSFLFFVNFFKNFDNINIFMNSIRSNQMIDIINFSYFCKTNPTAEEFENFQMSSEALLNLIQSIDNYVRVSKGLPRIFY